MLVALSLIALLGFAALVIDVGALYAERAELQSGSDAAALAIAQDCAGGVCGDTTLTAQGFLDDNANDNAANIGSVTFPTASSVRVEGTTRDGVTGPGSLALTFAPVLGFNSETVSATSTAVWGSPGQGPAVLPLTFSPCEFDLTGAYQIIRVMEPGGAGECSGPAGHNVPGGFGWVGNSSDSVCEENVTAGAVVNSSTGVSLPGGCEAVLTSLMTAQDKTILLPVFENVWGTGSSGQYKIWGWAAFEVVGWNFTGGVKYNNTAALNSPVGLTCNGDCKGFIGRFVEYVSLDEGFTPGGPDLGTSIVYLTE